MTLPSLERLGTLESAEGLRERLLEPVRGLLSGLDQVYLFGARKLGAAAKRYCDAAGIRVEGFLDNDPAKWGSRIGDLDVLSPRFAAGHPERVVILCSLLHERAMRRQLEQLGVGRILFYPLLTLWDASRFPPTDAFDGFVEDLFHNRARYVDLMACLSDDLSRRVLDKILLYRMTLDASVLSEAYCPDSPHYFDPSIVKLKSEEVFVDGGAHRGTTSERFIQAVGGTYKRIYLFEPDPVLLQAAKERLNGWPDVVCLERALYSRSATLRFSPGDLDGALCEDGTVQVAATSMDEAIAEPVTLIKMDVEGAEPEALQGAGGHIVSDVPALALSAYHRPVHLWQLREGVLALEGSRYRFYLRHHTDNITDTVLYCVPA